MDAVAYIRVSTARQGRSGLGLEAQARAIDDYVQANGCHVLATFREVESGRHDDRPELHKALELCRLTGARLVIAKLDRLGRNAEFLFHIRNSGVDFVACDMPGASRFTVGIMFCLADEECRMISDRTKAALQAAKARGVKLGNPRGAAAIGEVGIAHSREKRAAKADAFARSMAGLIQELQADGITSLNAIAGELNARHIKTARGGQWHASTVRNLLGRMGKE